MLNKKDSALKFLFLCAQSCRRNEPTLRVTEFLELHQDWDRIVKVADTNGLLPVLYRGLIVNYPELASESAFKEFSQHLQENREKNVNFLRELSGHLSLLQENGIHALTFKGLATSHLAYGDFTLRKISDIDIIVPRNDFSRAARLLLERGYYESKHFSISEKHIILSNENFKFVLDLHKSLGQLCMPEPNYDLIWNNRADLHLSDLNISAFSLKDSIIVSCMYLVRDWHNGDNYIRYVLDVAMLIWSHQISDWDEILDHARLHNVHNAVYISLHVVRRLLSQDLEIRMPMLPRRKRLARFGDKIFEGRGQVKLVGELGGLDHLNILYNRKNIYLRMIIRRHVFEWMSREFRRFIFLLFGVGEKDRKFLPLPPALHGFYYVLRPIRLTVLCAQTIGQKVRKTIFKADRRLT